MENKTNKKLLKKNYEFFKKILPGLLKDQDKKDKFAIIKEESLIGIYETLEQAIDTATKEKKFKLGTFLVQKIEKQQIHRISRTA